MTDYVLTGLVKRRAEIAGEIEAIHKRLSKVLVDLEHIDAAIVQFDPAILRRASGPRLSGRRRTGASTARCAGLCCPSCGRQPSR